MTPEQAAQKYHWCKYDATTNTVELYLDNFMLSSSRICESMFYMEHLLWIKPKYTRELGPTPDGKILRKPWFFDFGEFIHFCLELFYNHYKHHKSPPIIEDWLVWCKAKWDIMKMDEYANSVVNADVTKYEEVKGWEGVAGLLVQYYAFYMDMRLRVIDTEITFGHGKEVPIGEFNLRASYREEIYQDAPEEYDTIKCYLTGRIDLLVDNGYKIGPVDHKTTHKFDGYEHEDFNPHDGITGYILAINSILAKYKEQGLTNIPQCNGGWIYHISSCTPSVPNKKSVEKGKKQQPRFKTTPIDKNDQQLEDYKARQLSTFKRIAELLFNDKTPEWNTTACNFMFGRHCQFKPIHEQPSDQWSNIIQQFYTIGKPWDTRDHTTVKETEGEEKGTIQSS